MKAFAIYTLLRLGLFVTTYAVLAWAWVLVFGKGGMLLLPFVAAIIVSSLLSLKLLAPQRERLAASVQARAERASARFDEIRSREDEDEPSRDDRATDQATDQVTDRDSDRGAV